MTDESHPEIVTAAEPARHSFLGCGCLWAGVLLLAVVVVLLLPAIVPQPASPSMQCCMQLKQIVLAMLNYEQAHRCFPPAYVADAKGRPLYSWRVLILPYMERNDLYKKVRLDEPWDSPHNREILQDGAVAKQFHCPSADNPEDETSYVMIVGANAISDGPHSVRVKDIKDGMSTIMIAETRNNGIHWAEPRDLDFESMTFRVNDPNDKGISSCHSRMACVGLADGAVRFIGDGFDPKLLRALITINGGEDVSEFTK